MSRMRDERRPNSEDRATQQMEAGGWVSQKPTEKVKFHLFWSLESSKQTNSRRKAKIKSNLIMVQLNFDNINFILNCSIQHKIWFFNQKGRSLFVCLGNLLSLVLFSMESSQSFAIVIMITSENSSTYNSAALMTYVKLKENKIYLNTETFLSPFPINMTF